MKPTFPSYFEPALSPEDYQQFLAILKTGNRKTLRVNTLKISLEEFKEQAQEMNLKLNEIPWTKEGFWYDFDSTSLGNSDLYNRALIYLQDASSLLPVEALDPEPGEMVLDLAAAPGGKTTFIAQKMQNQGLIVANEVVSERAYTLQKMLEKYGVINTAITAYDPSFFAKFYPNFFDRILLDAPCSGEGMRALGRDLLHNFSYNKIKFNAKRQKRLLKEAFVALKPGGTLVYSTCALAVEENEEVADFILQTFPDSADLVSIENVKAEGLTQFMNKDFDQKIKKTVRLWPHLWNTNGFYVAKISKAYPTNKKAEEFKTPPPKFQNWQKVPEKVGLQFEHYLEKHYGLSHLVDHDHYELIQHQNELWLQPKLLKQIKKTKILYAGIKVGDIGPNKEIILNSSFSYYPIS